MARAFRWQRYIDEGKFKNSADLALAVGKDQGAVARILRLTLLAPDIVHRILMGNIPSNLTVNKLRSGFPDVWTEQKKELLSGQ